MLQLLQLALFSSAFAALADEHKFMPPLLDIFPNEASVQPSTKSPSVTPSKLEVSNYGLHPLDIHSYRILFYDLRAGPYHPQRPLLHTLCPFLMLFANLLERTCPLFFWPTSPIRGLPSSTIRFSSKVAARRRSLSTTCQRRTVGHMLTRDTGSANADFTHASLVGINA